MASDCSEKIEDGFCSEFIRIKFINIFKEKGEVDFFFRACQ